MTLEVAICRSATSARICTPIDADSDSMTFELVQLASGHRARGFGDRHLLNERAIVLGATARSLSIIYGLGRCGNAGVRQRRTCQHDWLLMLLQDAPQTDIPLVSFKTRIRLQDSGQCGPEFIGMIDP